MKIIRLILSITWLVLYFITVFGQSDIQQIHDIPYDIYPEVLDQKPALPSPFCLPDGKEFVVAVTREEKYAIVPVTLNNDRGICQQLIIDTLDFPELITTGLHSEDHLNRIGTITGRSLEEISSLGKPGGLSSGGFLAENEDIIQVLIGDNRLVRRLGFTHPQMAKPMFHVLNMMDMDLSLNRWNMARHEWENITWFLYNEQKVNVRAFDTKGGQLSIFDDNIEGAFHIKLWHELSEQELAYLRRNYDQLSPEEFGEFTSRLTFMNIGEMQPQYIMRYGFYEGHTFWRADPIVVAFIFGMKRLEELDDLFDKKLNLYLSGSYQGQL